MVEGAGIDNTGTWTDSVRDPVAPGHDCLFAPAVGTDSNERIGRTTWVKKIYISWVVHLDYQAYDGTPIAPQDARVRLALVQDTQTNGVQMLGDQVFQNPAIANPINVINTHQNIANLGRFRVLRDETHHLPLDFDYEPGPPMFHCKSATIQGDWIYKPKTPIEVNYNQLSGASVADIVDNSFHFLAHTSSPVNQLVPLLHYECRVTYCG